MDGNTGVGGGRYFIYRPPLGSSTPFDLTCAAQIRQSRRLTWSSSSFSGKSVARGGDVLHGSCRPSPRLLAGSKMSAAATPATAAEASHTYRNSIPSDGEHDAGAVDFTCGRAPPSRACRREGSRNFRFLGRRRGRTRTGKNYLGEPPGVDGISFTVLPRGRDASGAPPRSGCSMLGTVSVPSRTSRRGSRAAAAVRRRRPRAAASSPCAMGCS